MFSSLIKQNVFSISELSLELHGVGMTLYLNDALIFEYFDRVMLNGMVLRPI